MPELDWYFYQISLCVCSQRPLPLSDKESRKKKMGSNRVKHRGLVEDWAVEESGIIIQNPRTTKCNRYYW